MLKFTKMHGIGNDYIYFDCTKAELSDPAALSVRLSDRHFGVGGDGIVMILPSASADFRMRMFNADGSEGKMCGNAIRCIGKYVYERGLTDKTTLNKETLSGIKHLYLNTENGVVASVRVDMGKAELSAARIPVISDKEKVIGQSVEIAGEWSVITCVSMGNPHCVIFRGGIDGLDLEKIGPEYENAPIFPDRVNTEFAEIISESEIKMRVWERGSGETMACGTGACATVVAAVENGYCPRGRDVKVRLRGGDLTVKYMPDGTVFMTGPAAFVFDGTVTEE